MDIRKTLGKENGGNFVQFMSWQTTKDHGTMTASKIVRFTTRLSTQRKTQRGLEMVLIRNFTSMTTRHGSL